MAGNGLTSTSGGYAPVALHRFCKCGGGALNGLCCTSAAAAVAVPATALDVAQGDCSTVAEVSRTTVPVTTLDVAMGGCFTAVAEGSETAVSGTTSLYGPTGSCDTAVADVFNSGMSHSSSLTNSKADELVDSDREAAAAAESMESLNDAAAAVETIAPSAICQKTRTTELPA